jgi:hypothetical protein
MFCDPLIGALSQIAREVNAVFIHFLTDLWMGLVTVHIFGEDKVNPLMFTVGVNG